MVDLLGSGDWKLSTGSAGSTEQEEVSAATVSLLRSVRIPAHHSRLAQVETMVI